MDYIRENIDKNQQKRYNFYVQKTIGGSL